MFVSWDCGPAWLIVNGVNDDGIFVVDTIAKELNGLTDDDILGHLGHCEHATDQGEVVCAMQCGDSSRVVPVASLAWQ